METIIATIQIIVEDWKSVGDLNGILTDFGEFIIGRLGIPYHKKNVNVISIAIDASKDIIEDLRTKLEKLDGVNVKIVYSDF